MGSDELVERLQKEAAMLREIAKSQARGVDWQANLTASAEWFDRASAQLAEARESERAAVVAYLRSEPTNNWTWKALAQSIEAGDHLT